MELQAEYVCHEFDTNDANRTEDHGRCRRIYRRSVPGYYVPCGAAGLSRAAAGDMAVQPGRRATAMRGLIEREMSGAEDRVQVLSLSEPSPHDWPIRTFVNVLDLLEIAEEGSDAANDLCPSRCRTGRHQL